MFLGAKGEARGVLDGLSAARAFAPAGIEKSAPIGLWGYSGGAFASSVAAQRVSADPLPQLRGAEGDGDESSCARCSGA